MNNDKKISHDEARVLTELFMAGATTCADEKDLYTYYNSDDVASDLLQYRDMMRWYAAGMPAKTIRKPHIAHRMVRIWRIAGIAAMLAIVFTTGISYLSYRNERNEELAMYEGSYIIRDGKKITDLNEILPELKRAEAYVAQNTQNYDAETIINDMSRDIIDRQTNPSMREAMKAILEN